MTRPELDAVAEPDVDPSEDESENLDNYEPGCDECKDYEMQCKLTARDFLTRTRGMSNDEAEAFIKATVTWNVTSVSWEDAGEARSADASVTFNFGEGKALVDASVEYHHRVRFYEVEYFCKVMWDGSGSNTSILQKAKFMLKATHVKGARERCLPDGWPAAEAMEFIYRCCGVGGWGPCQAADSKNGLSGDTEKVCKTVDKPAAKKKAPAKSKATGASGGVAKVKAVAGKGAAGKAK